MMERPLRVATRGSQLALRQVDLVEQRLGMPVERVIVTTSGDRTLDRPLHEIGGQGVFVKEVQRAVLAGDADFAVHSAKELTSTTPDGLHIAGVLPRGDVRDAVVGARLAELPLGSRVATGSVRSAAQLAGLRPDLQTVPLRGNIATRLKRLTDVDAVLMAAVALDRTGRQWSGQRLDPWVMVPQVGQGAIAVECRRDDHLVRSLLSPVDDPATHVAIRTERDFLRAFGEGCDQPVGAVATTVHGRISLLGLFCTPTGDIVRGAMHGGDDDDLGGRLADRLHSMAAGRAEMKVAFNGVAV